LFGTTSGGGAVGQGTVFELPKGGRFTVLYSFSGLKDGTDPFASLVLGPTGDLYGTTYLGGSPNCNGNSRNSSCGTIFKLDQKGRRTVLHRFTKPKIEGNFPTASLIQDAAGDFYSTTSLGGSSGLGTVFKLNTSGVETVLHTFRGTDGAVPGGLIQDAAGNFYGTTGGGGAGFGTVFKLDTQGVETVLYAFSGGPDGGTPLGSAIIDSAGNLYGTTYAGGGTPCLDGQGCGVVFKLDPSGKETVLYSFTGEADGSSPEAGLVMDAAGNLYGTTTTGGAISNACPSGCGVVFKITP
jgi:uncharacterized repeat protein (TIGR03803 family)